MFTDETYEVRSELSSFIVVEGERLRFQIFRLSFYPLWAVEVISERGSSLVWDELFATEHEALAAFQIIADDEGVAYFVRHTDLGTLQ